MILPIEQAALLFPLPERITVHPRPVETDLIIGTLDFLTFLILTWKLATGRLLTGSVIYRAGWGILAIGTLWQGLVSYCRVFGYYLPDVIWSGWALQDLGIFIVVISTLDRPKLDQS